MVETKKRGRSAAVDKVWKFLFLFFFKSKLLLSNYFSFIRIYSPKQKSVREPQHRKRRKPTKANHQQNVAGVDLKVELRETVPINPIKNLKNHHHPRKVVDVLQNQRRKKNHPKKMSPIMMKLMRAVRTNRFSNLPFEMKMRHNNNKREDSFQKQNKTSLPVSIFLS